MNTDNEKRVVLADDGELPPAMRIVFFAAGILIGVMLIATGAR